MSKYTYGLDHRHFTADDSSSKDEDSNDSSSQSSSEEFSKSSEEEEEEEVVVEEKPKPTPIPQTVRKNQASTVLPKLSKATIFERLSSKIFFQDNAIDDIARIMTRVLIDNAFGKPCIFPMVLCGPKGSGKASSIKVLANLFDMQKGGKNERCFIHCDASITQEYQDMNESIYKRFVTAYHKCCDNNRSSPLVIILVENIDCIVDTPKLYPLDYIIRGTVPSYSKEIKDFEIPSWMKVLVVCTASFGVEMMHSIPVEDYDDVFDSFKYQVIEKEMLQKGFYDKEVSSISSGIIPFFPPARDKIEKMLHDRFDDYITNTRFSKKYGKPSTDESLRIIQFIMNQYDNDGNIGNAYKTLKNGINAFLEGGYSYFEQQLPQQKIKLTPKASIVCESFAFDDKLIDEKMKEPSFELAIKDSKNKRNFNTIMKHKTGLDILKMEHELLKSPYISIMAPCVNVNQYIKVKCNDPLLQEKYDKALLELKEYQERFHNVDKKLDIMLNVIESDDKINPISKKRLITIGQANSNMLTNYENVVEDSLKRKDRDDETPQNDTKRVKRHHIVTDKECDEMLTCVHCNMSKHIDKFKKVSGCYVYDLTKKKTCLTCHRKIVKSSNECK